MLTAAAAGRCLDALGSLPGVHETTAVRNGPASWTVALAVAAVAAAVTAGQWSRTGSFRSTAAVAVPGQLVVFFCAEAVVRLTNGVGAVDPDGFVGAGLQSALAVVLLLAIGMSAMTAQRCVPLRMAHPPAGHAIVLTGPRCPTPLRYEIQLIARGPPKQAV